MYTFCFLYLQTTTSTSIQYMLTINLLSRKLYSTCRSKRRDFYIKLQRAGKRFKPICIKKTRAFLSSSTSLCVYFFQNNLIFTFSLPVYSGIFLLMKSLIKIISPSLQSGSSQQTCSPANNVTFLQTQKKIWLQQWTWNLWTCLRSAGQKP